MSREASGALELGGTQEFPVGVSWEGEREERKGLVWSSASTQ